MKKNINKLIISILIIIIAFAFLLYFGVKKNKESKQNIQDIQEDEISNDNKYVDNNIYTKMINGVKTNTSEKLHEEKRLGNIVVENVILTYEKDRSSMVLLVENIGKNTVGDYDAKIILKDTKGNTIEELEIYVDTIGGESKGVIKAEIVGDITNAYDYEILR